MFSYLSARYYDRLISDLHSSVSPSISQSLVPRANGVWVAAPKATWASMLP